MLHAYKKSRVRTYIPTTEYDVYTNYTSLRYLSKIHV